jgi:small conductance mechanosensitive channel
MSLLETATRVQDVITRYAVTPLLILFIGIFIGKILEQTLLFIFHEFKRTSHPYIYGAYVTKWVVYIATVCAALASIGVLRYALWFFAGIVVALVLVRIILGMFSFFPNFFSYHAVKRRYKEGTKVKTKLVEGTVVRVQLLDTHLRSADGDELFVPNTTMRTLKKA